MKGVLAPVLTPVRPDLTPDTERFVRHCRWLLDHGCSGLAPFGTSSEANSFSTDERLAMLESLVAAGLPAAQLMPGTGCCALSDTVRLTAHAVKLGCGGVLMLPPFYYKNIPDDGLYRYFADVIERIGDARLQIYLYHIPQMANVPLSLGLIERLIKAYPSTVVGIKDSAGDWNNTQALLKAFAPDFAVFTGKDAFLLKTLLGGGAGCITACANINPHGLHALYQAAHNARADELQTQVTKLVTLLDGRAYFVATYKGIIAHYAADPGWLAVRPPILELTPQQSHGVIRDLAALGFTMPGLGAAGRHDRPAA
jgi:4-hydroxy-tetrahydrodipicolinate synthase